MNKTINRFIYLLLLVIFTATLPQAYAEDYVMDEEVEAIRKARKTEEKEEEEKKEPKLVLPPFFESTSDLLEVDVLTNRRQKFYVDPKSLSIFEKPDYIVRYTLVAISPSGAQNISYESINCSEREYKRHAYASRKEGKTAWALSREPKWIRISTLDKNQIRFTLFSDYFCELNAPSGDVESIIKRIKERNSVFWGES